MRQDFRSTTQQRSTARELANEMSGFAASLQETAKELKQEIEKIQTARGAIEKERDTALVKFVKATVQDINGKQLDVLSEIGQGVPQLGKQSLTYLRSTTLSTRETALQTIAEVSGRKVDAASAAAVVSETKAQIQAESAQWDSAEENYHAADRALKTWKAAPEYNFTVLSDAAVKKLDPAIDRDSRDYYSPGNIFSAAFYWLQRSAEYRAIRSAMVAYGYEDEGKDIFSDITGWRSRTAALTAEAKRAYDLYDAVDEKQAQAHEKLNKLDLAARAVKTDAEILASLQQSAVAYLAVPEYAQAVSAQFAESFPQDAQMVSAKLKVMEKLEQGAQKKLDALNKTITEVTREYRKLNDLRPYTEVVVDMDDFRLKNRARKATYDNYTVATRDSWTRARDYRAPDNTVYVDRSPSLFEWWLITDMLSRDRHQHDSGTFVPSATSCYTAEMLGIDRAEARRYGVPGTVFDVSPVIVHQMQELGVTNYDVKGNFSIDLTQNSGNRGAFSFDIIEPPAPEPTVVRGGGSFGAEQPVVRGSGTFGGSSETKRDWSPSETIGGSGTFGNRS